MLGRSPRWVRGWGVGSRVLLRARGGHCGMVAASLGPPLASMLERSRGDEGVARPWERPWQRP